MQKESHFLEVCRYVVLNPVRAKTVKHPIEWTWSSYRATGGQSPILSCLKVDDILSHFGHRRGMAQEKYREYVREGIGVTSLWENLEAQSLLGLEGFAEALKEHVTGKETIQEIPKGQRFLGRLSLKKLFESTKGKAPVGEKSSTGQMNRQRREIPSEEVGTKRVGHLVQGHSEKSRNVEALSSLIFSRVSTQKTRAKPLNQ